MMKLVKQKTKTDCGVACLAVLAGISWSSARNALFDDQRKDNFGTDTQQMRAALKKFGIITSKRLVRCKNPSKNPDRLTKDALLHTNKLADGHSHWAVWDAQRMEILDPYYKRTRVHSFLSVLRRVHQNTK